MNILVVTGDRIIRRKLESKLAPILALRQVNKVYLVTGKSFHHEKVQAFFPKRILSGHVLLKQVYKMVTILAVLLHYRPHAVLSVGLVPHGVYTLLLGALFKKKKIFLSMGMNELIYSDRGGLARLLRKIASLADRVGTRGTFSREQLVRAGFVSEKIFIPHNVFDFSAFKPVRCGKIFDLVYVGVLESYKRLDILFDVIHRLVHEKGLEDICLAIVGEGSLKKQWTQTVYKLGLGQQIRFFPPGNAEYVCRVLNQSRVFVMTSQSEGLPMAVIEALSCGLPVVAFDHADLGDVARHDRNSLLCPVGDLACFSDHIEKLLKNRSCYEALASNASMIRGEKEKEYSLESVSRVWQGALF